MVECTDADLFLHATRAAGKVVLITGAAQGIGRRTALDFARYGAKIVIGDLQLEAATRVVEEITGAGGEAVSFKCDVTNWEDQNELFKSAIRTFGTVDIVVPNAGVAELGGISQSIAGPEPVKPNLKTIEVNLIGTFYTVQLALFHFGWSKHRWDKALILVGSLASVVGIPMGYEYSASKHALVGLMGALFAQCLEFEIRLGLVAPWFTDTTILDTGVRLMLAGLPFTKIERVSGSIVAAATYTDPSTSGAIWSIPDDKEVFRIDHGDIHRGPYKILMTRTQRAFQGVGWALHTYRTLSDVFDLFGTRILLFTVAIALGAVLWRLAQ